MKAYQLGLYEKSMPASLTWKEKLRETKAAGFDHLEISIDEKDDKLARLDWTEAEKKELRDAIVEVGVPVSSLCLSGHRRFPLGSHDPAVRARSLDIMEKAIDFAVDFGVRIIQLAGYDVYYEEGDEATRAFFAENLQQAVDMAARKSVLLGFETMETPFMDTVGKAMHYVRQIASPYLGVYPDIGNLKNASLVHGHDLIEDIRTGRGSIFATHLKETIPGHYREIPFGTGHTDYIPCLQELKAQGVRYFTAEFWYIGAGDWRGDLAFAAKYLSEKLDDVFA
ncbi:MAG: L-ribulose-5-phosphate 3-epimerase [Bacillota bacterium]|nr:L-ribulose-5-phosphate 3-epimerase [Bacillota bacterium]